MFAERRGYRQAQVDASRSLADAGDVAGLRTHLRRSAEIRG
jgi:hypothetical protein